MVSGFDTLERQMPGWLHEGRLIVIAGRQGVGKSALAQQIIESVAGQNRSAIFFSLGLSRQEVAERSIVRQPGMSFSKLKTSTTLEAGERERIVSAGLNFYKLPILTDVTAYDVIGLLEKAIIAAGWFKQRHMQPLGCIVVDYLELVAGRSASVMFDLEQLTGGLKRLAEELRIPIIAISKLDLGVDSRNKRPVLADLPQPIEQNSDLVLLLHREGAGMVDIITAKNNHGPTGVSKFAFIDEQVMFVDPLIDQHRLTLSIDVAERGTLALYDYPGHTPNQPRTESRLSS